MPSSREGASSAFTKAPKKEGGFEPSTWAGRNETRKAFSIAGKSDSMKVILFG